MTTAQADHEPLDASRHADLVAYLQRSAPHTWMVIFRPDDYLYDERDRLLATELELEASELRIQFYSETDWRRMMRLIRRLLQIDADCCRMSIGTRIDGIERYGEYCGADRDKKF